MDALLASDTPIGGPSSRRRGGASRPRPHHTVQRGSSKPAIDPSLHSILPSTRLAPSLHSAHSLKPDPSISRVPDKKLRAKLASQSVARQRAAVDREEVQEYLNTGEGGGIEVDEVEGERTWRVGQEEVVDAIAEGSRGKRFDLKLENIGGGGYAMDYTRNGRHLAIASNYGHVATFDWQAGRMHSELQLRESVRCIKFLHSEAFYAVAQKKYVFIYDQSGTEIHKMKQHIDVTRMEFLPYHYLLATVGNAGYLKYHDTSTGLMVADHKTRLGPATALAQNPHNAILHLGHTNGTMTLWSPNMSTPHVKLLAHVGPVQSIAVDPSAASMGRYIATSGADGQVKLWDARNWGQTVRQWHDRRSGVHELAFSMKGMLAVSGKGGVTAYRDAQRQSGKPPSPYLQLPLPGVVPRSIAFCPFEDILGVGHSAGFSSLLVPGAGEAQFDSNEADVFESYNRRREREVRGVLEKIQPDLITLDANFLGRIGEAKKENYSEKAKPFYQMSRLDRLRTNGQADEADENGARSDDGSADEAAAGAEGPAKRGQGAIKREKEKHKMRGKGKSMKRFLKKKRKNVIDPTTLAVKEKIAREKAKREQAGKIARGEVKVETGALSRFT